MILTFPIAIPTYPAKPQKSRGQRRFKQHRSRPFLSDQSVKVCVPAHSVLRTVSPSLPVRRTSASASNGTVNV